MWKLTIDDDEGKQSALSLSHDEYGVGRADTNAIRLTDRNISRKHAIFRKRGETWFVADDHSYNGTFVGGVRVESDQALQPGDVVQIGDYRIELQEDVTEVPVVPVAVPGAPSQQRPNRLVVVVGPTPGAEFPLDRDQFTIGRTEEATISINHSSVSRLHAELIAIGNGRYEIVDKGSANGIRINGVELERGILEAGDALELGDVRLRYVGAGKTFRADQSQQLSAVAAFASIVPSSVRAPGAPKPPTGVAKLVGLGAVVGAMVIVATMALTRSGPASQASSDAASVTTATVSADDARDRLTLAQAQKTLDAKDYEGAHQTLLAIPESSPLREEAAFRDIEAAWADWTFAKVDDAPLAADKKRLLKSISATSTVDAARRKHAADMVQDIEAKEPPAPAPPPTYGGGDPNAVRAAVATGGSTLTPIPVASTKADAPLPVPAAAPGASDEDAIRKSLEAKVWGGHASIDEIKMLKAVCGHLGNRGCRDRAAAMLKKKQEQP